MAAYCRVSTDREEQQSSYELQVAYYTHYITSNPAYRLAGIYADEGISATSTRKRENFNRMIEDCRVGKIDRIITKSISRFARNTLDCLNYVRELKALGIGITFEKENIDTLDAKGEVLLTILSSLAQDESRSISENSTWGIRKRFEAGQYSMSTMRFMGYDRDEHGKLVVNPEQAEIVKRIFQEYLDGKTPELIVRIFQKEGICKWDGTTDWNAPTIRRILENEKYMGDAILQKSYTMDFLQKKRVKNEGAVKKVHIQDDHEAIIPPDIWQAVQLETERREAYKQRHKVKTYAKNVDFNVFATKVICGTCGKVFSRKTWSCGSIWQCSGRYREKGVAGCQNRHTYTETIENLFIFAWNSLIAIVDVKMMVWARQLESENSLTAYRAKRMTELVKRGPIETVEFDLVLATLESITVFEDGTFIVRFLDGTKIEHKGE